MQNFLIVGTQRIGSSAIAESIGLHPEIICGWEWTLHTRVDRKVSVGRRALTGDFSALREAEREHARASSRKLGKWLGYRCLFRSSDKWIIHPSISLAIWLDGLYQHLHWLKVTPEIHVIHVVRRNNMAWLRSKYMSRETGAYSGVRYPSDARVQINLREAVRRIQAKNWLDAKLARLAISNPYSRVIYEDFVEDQPGALRHVFNFLGCRDTEILDEHRMLAPQSTSKLEEQVLNFERLQSKLSHLGLLESGEANW